MNYYNEIDPYCGQWLRNLIQGKYIPDGKVDERSIADVTPGDLDGFTQCHFFAGLAGWPRALELAGWPSDRQVWTGSCPCQPFSVAGKRKGDADERHLWPEFYRLIASCRPDVVMGEQVSGAAGMAWLDGVVADLEGEGYTVGAADIPACAVNAPHRRNRLYWVAHRLSPRLEGRQGERLDDGQECATVERGGDERGGLGDSVCQRDADTGRTETPETPRRVQGADGEWERIRADSGKPDDVAGFWDFFTLIGPDRDGKWRRAKPGVRLLAHGVPARVARLRALGNAIVPQCAAEFVAAFLDTEEMRHERDDFS